MNFKILLFPFSILYGIIVYIRNLFYEKQWIKSYEIPNIKTICIGNLSTGGTGKTPHVDFLIQILKKQYNIATLSRGYKRKTKGFVLADQNTNANQIGDEPLQLFLKNKNITVAVCENRVLGVQKLIEENKSLDVVILDDGFQHRKLKANHYIILSDYNHIFTNDFLLPIGNLREFRSGVKRADIIIVSKCPSNINKIEKEKIISKIKPYPHQIVLFSWFSYQNPISIHSNENKIINWDNIENIILFTGIAKPKQLKKYLENFCQNIIPFYFPDHYYFKKNDIELIKTKFLKLNDKTIIITTEKDFSRLKFSKNIEALNLLPIYYIPIKVEMDFHDKTIFNDKIQQYVKSTL